jgi:hypothetical protein
LADLVLDRRTFDAVLFKHLRKRGVPAERELGLRDGDEFLTIAVQ